MESQELSIKETAFSFREIFTRTVQEIMKKCSWLQLFYAKKGRSLISIHEMFKNFTFCKFFTSLWPTIAINLTFPPTKTAIRALA
jgi:hypothetical protein